MYELTLLRYKKIPSLNQCSSDVSCWFIIPLIRSFLVRLQCLMTCLFQTTVCPSLSYFSQWKCISQSSQSQEKLCQLLIVHFLVNARVWGACHSRKKCVRFAKLTLFREFEMTGWYFCLVSMILRVWSDFPDEAMTSLVWW